MVSRCSEVVAVKKSTAVTKNSRGHDENMRKCKMGCD